MKKLAIITFLIATMAPVAFAQVPAGSGNSNPTLGTGNPTPAAQSGSNVTLKNPLGTSCNSANTDCLMNFLNKILAFVIKIGTVVVILMLVFVGYKFVAAQGAPGKIEEARTMLLWTVIGALVLLGAQAISSAIQATVTAISS